MAGDSCSRAVFESRRARLCEPVDGGALAYTFEIQLSHEPAHVARPVVLASRTAPPEASGARTLLNVVDKVCRLVANFTLLSEAVQTSSAVLLASRIALHGTSGAQALTDVVTHQCSRIASGIVACWLNRDRFALRPLHVFLLQLLGDAALQAGPPVSRTPAAQSHFARAPPGCCDAALPPPQAVPAPSTRLDEARWCLAVHPPRSRPRAPRAPAGGRARGTRRPSSPTVHRPTFELELGEP
eukprot:scaffold23561_cov32-Tisochrysis_lutea.AAC.2